VQCCYVRCRWQRGDAGMRQVRGIHPIESCINPATGWESGPLCYRRSVHEAGSRLWWRRPRSRQIRRQSDRRWCTESDREYSDGARSLRASVRVRSRLGARRRVQPAKIVAQAWTLFSYQKTASRKSAFASAAKRIDALSWDTASLQFGFDSAKTFSAGIKSVWPASTRRSRLWIHSPTRDSIGRTRCLPSSR